MGLVEVFVDLLVGCEPATLGGEQGHMGLSDPVMAAVDEAARLVENLIARLLRGDKLEDALEIHPKGQD